jgi:hypothetical protein
MAEVIDHRLVACVLSGMHLLWRFINRRGIDLEPLHGTAARVQHFKA